MFRTFYCLKDHHDWKLVLLAACVCLMACSVTILMLTRARTVRGAERLRWIVTAGVAGGFGIFATHFIAMMAYNAGLPVAFDVRLTVLSLVCVMAIAGGGAEIATSASFKGSSWVGGAVIGAGVGVMHYMGMMAVDMPGHIYWGHDLVVTSILSGLVLGALAMKTLEMRKRWSGPAATALLLLAIVAHHFIAMGAVTVVPDALRHAEGMAVSPSSLSVILATVAVGVLILCSAAVHWGRRLDEANAASDRRFRALLEGVTDHAIFMLDPEGRVTHWNGGAEKLMGYSAEEMVGKRFVEALNMSLENVARHAEGVETAIREGRFAAEYLSRRKNMDSFWAHMTISPVRDEDGTLIGLAHVSQDITARKVDSERILTMSRNLDAALSHMSQGLCLFDRDEKLILANGRFGEFYGLDRALATPGTSFRTLISAIFERLDGHAPSPEKLEEAHAYHRAIITQPGGGTVVSELIEDRPVAISHRPMPDGGWVTTLDDMTQQRVAEQRIAHMARYDELTALPNRQHFADKLDAELARANREGEQVAVSVIDLDRFQDLNDLHGHGVGDAALKILGERLTRMAFDDRRFVSRLGGDEFGAIRRFVRGEGETAFHESMRILHTGITAPMQIDGVEISLAACLGVAIYPRDGVTREALLNNADMALQRAKAPGAEPICLYDAADEAARDRRALAKDLQRALAEDEFRVFYQVQQSVATREITGYEALIRWKHPARGFVSPGEFIGVAEESGAIVEMGAWVLRAACRTAAAWDNKVRIAVNLSPVQLKDVNLIETVRNILAETGLNPGRLELEITESTIIEDRLTALHILRQIKALGVSIAIDDFGTGYASLDTLNAFPFDKIKIDRSFLMQADTSSQARAIVRAILALGKSLSIPVLAEGVETEAQLAILREEGCEEAQGYLLGRPAEDILPETARKAS